MAVGNKNYYRLTQTQIRHSYQTGQKAGLRDQDMESIFSELAAQTDDAIAEAASLATDAGMPESTTGPILDGVRKRAGMIGKNIIQN